MAPPRRWIRLDVGWSRSDWLADLSPAARLAWIELLTYTKAEGVGGEVKAVSPGVFGRMCGIPAEDVAAMLDAAQKDGALVVEGRTWRIANWDAYQESDRTAAERKRRQRDRLRTEGDAIESHGCHAVTTVTTRDVRRDPSMSMSMSTSMSTSPDSEGPREISTSTPSTPRAHAREEDLGRLRAYLGPYADAVDRFAASAAHSATWAAAILGLYGPQGTDQTVWQRSPPEARPALLARALDRYAGESMPYHGKLFRRFLEAVIHEHANNGSASTPSGNDRRPAPNGRGEAARARPAAEPIGGDPSRRSRWVYE